MRAPSIWKTLGIKASSDKTDIRRAYAKKLKLTHPEDDPEGFKVLRAAYEQALQRAAWQTVSIDVPDEAPGADEAKDDAVPASSLAASESAPIPAAPQEIASEAVARDADQARYGAACERLEKLLKPRAAADDAAKLDALDAVLTSSVLDSIAMRDTAEFWLAQLITRTRPRSDVLIAPVIARFGWDERRLDHRQPYGVHALFRRADDLKFLKAISSPDSDNCKAYQALSAPPPSSFFGRLFQKASHSDVEELLGRIRRSHAGVEDDLNADAVRLWEERLKHPDVSGVNLWMLGLTPPCLLIIACAALVYGWNGLPLYLFLSIPPLWALTVIGVRWAYEASQNLWQQNWQWQTNPFLAMGWAPGLLVLLFISALPPSPWLTGATTVGALGLGWWAAVTGEPDKSPSTWPWQLRLLLAEVFVVLWWCAMAFDLNAGAVWQMLPMIAAIPVVSGYGRMPLFRGWLRIGANAQRGILAALIVAALMATYVLWTAYPDESLRPLAYAGAAVVILTHRVPVLSSSAWSSSLIRVVCYLALVITRMQGGPVMTVAIVGSILLGLAVINCGVALSRVGRS